MKKVPKTLNFYLIIFEGFPCVTVHFAQGTTSVLRTRISLEIHVHTPGMHSKLMYFKHEQLHTQN